ncbi:cytidine deaminase-like fold-containing protein [Neisseria sp. Ec49-e6-T10]
MAAAAEAAKAKSVTITAFDQDSGITRHYLWSSGMKSIQEVKK